MHDNNLSRAQRIWKRVFAERGNSGLSLHRARLLTESWKETEGLPVPVRRARAFRKIVEGIPLYIDDEQLLVGDFASKPQWAEWYPEFSAAWVLEEDDSEAALKVFKAHDVDTSLMKEIAEYWSDKCVEKAFFHYITPEKKDLWMGMGEEYAYIHRWLAFLDRLGGYHVLNYEKAIKKGFSGILDEIRQQIQDTRIRDDDSLRKVNFLKACEVVMEAGIRYAGRYCRSGQGDGRESGRYQKSRAGKDCRGMRVGTGQSGPKFS